MKYVLTVISIICIAFFVWVVVDGKKRKKKGSQGKDKPLFRTEGDLEEYGKPMNPPSVDFDDAE